MKYASEFCFIDYGLRKGVRVIYYFLIWKVCDTDH
jgi:hypothetical protein